MISALETEIERAEQRRDFVADALEARAELARTGTAYDAKDVHSYLKARSAGRRTTRPRARRWQP